jgi:hypothetical protein
MSAPTNEFSLAAAHRADSDQDAAKKFVRRYQGRV